MKRHVGKKRGLGPPTPPRIVKPWCHVCGKELEDQDTLLRIGKEQYRDNPELNRAWVKMIGVACKSCILKAMKEQQGHFNAL